MPSSNATTARPLPLVMRGLASVLVVGHLLAVGVMALAAQSGPWLSPVGPSTGEPPYFASVINNITYTHYLQHIRMWHNYHFQSNRVGYQVPTAKFEIRLKDDQGEVVKTLHFPDDKANFWVRHRQGVLAQGLANDVPVQVRNTEMIPGTKKTVQETEYWETIAPMTMKIGKAPDNELPKGSEVYRPSEWGKLLAQAYMRYACREYGAASAELIRLNRTAIEPYLLLVQDPPSPEHDMFKVLKSNFGELAREN